MDTDIMTFDTSIELGPNEHQMSIQDSVQCANIIMKATLSDALQIPILEGAISHWQRRNKVLQVSIQQKGLKVYFKPEVELPPVSVTSHLLADMRDIISSEMDDYFEQGCYPLARLHYFHDNHSSILVMCISHVIVDGLSSAFLLNDLLVGYTRFLADKNCNHESLGKTSITEYKEVLKKYPDPFKGIRGKVKAYKNYFSYRNNSKLEKPIPSFSPLWKNNRDCCTQFIFLDKSQLKDIKKITKENSISVNSFLMSCWLSAVRTAYSDTQALPLSVYTPADLRSRLNGKVNQEELGLCTGLLRLTENISPSSNVHDIAKNINTKIKENLEAGEAHVIWQSLPPSSLAQLGSIGKSVFLNTIKNGLLTSSSAWTNMGDVNRYLSEKGCSVPSIVESYDISTMGGTPIPFVVCLMQHHNGLSINIVYSKKMLNGKVAIKIIDAFEKNIQQALLIEEPEVLLD